jgi:hypothetical protein
MVLYKISALKRMRLLKDSFFESTKTFFRKGFTLDVKEPKLVKLHDFKNYKKLKNWTLITDSIFGGNSNCELFYSGNESCKINF